MMQPSCYTLVDGKQHSSCTCALGIQPLNLTPSPASPRAPVPAAGSRACAPATPPAGTQTHRTLPPCSAQDKAAAMGAVRSASSWMAEGCNKQRMPLAAATGSPLCTGRNGHAGTSRYNLPAQLSRPASNSLQPTVPQSDARGPPAAAAAQHIHGRLAAPGCVAAGWVDTTQPGAGSGARRRRLAGTERRAAGIRQRAQRGHNAGQLLAPHILPEGRLHQHCVLRGWRGELGRVRHSAATAVFCGRWSDDASRHSGWIKMSWQGQRAGGGPLRRTALHTNRHKQ